MKLTKSLMLELLSSKESAIAHDPLQLYPLSNQQRWLLKSLVRSHAIDQHMSIAIDYRGTMEPRALQKSLERLLQQHSILRTLFPKIHGQTYQRVECRPEFRPACTITVVDTIEGLFSAQRERFDLEREFPVRLFLFSLDGTRHVVLLVLHRLAVDLWSVKPLVSDLFRTYLALTRGKDTVFPSATINYGDYAMMQQRSYAGSTPSSTEDTREAAAAVSSANSNSGVETSTGAVKSIGFRLNASLHRELVRFSSECGVAFHSIVHAAVAAALYLATSHVDVCFTTEVDPREDHSSRKLVGLFSTTMEISCNIAGPMTFRDLLASICNSGRSEASVVVSGSRRAHHPEYSEPRDCVGGILGPLLVVMRRIRDELSVRLWDGSIIMKHPAVPLYPFEVCFDLLEYSAPDGSADGLGGRVSYRSSVIKHAFAQRLLELFCNILRDAIVAADIDLRVVVGAEKTRHKTQSILPAERLRYLRPTNPTHYILLKIWQNVLGLHRIGMQDNFFDLGGDKSQFEQMLDLVELDTGEKLGYLLGDDAVTIDNLTRQLVHRSAGAMCREVIAATSTSRQPLILLHGDIDGGGFYTRRLGAQWPKDLPLYAFNPHGLDGSPVPSTIQEMAENYVELILSRQATGPFHVAGYCGAGLVAIEIARKLQQLGYSVGMVGLIASHYRYSVERADVAADAHTINQSKKYFGVTSAYYPEWYDGPVVMFSPVRQQNAEPDQKHWSRVAKKVTIRQVPGSHATCLTKSLDGLVQALLESVLHAQQVTNY